MDDAAQRRRAHADRALYDTPTRAAMNAHRSPVRDGQNCDQCGLPNFPPGWIHGGWTTYIDYPDSSSEGFGGLVLCALCYAEHVEAADGPGVALDVLNGIFRRHQQRIARNRQREAERRAAAGEAAPGPVSVRDLSGTGPAPQGTPAPRQGGVS